MGAFVGLGAVAAGAVVAAGAEVGAVVAATGTAVGAAGLHAARTNASSRMARTDIFFIGRLFLETKG